MSYFRIDFIRRNKIISDYISLIIHDCNGINSECCVRPSDTSYFDVRLTMSNCEEFPDDCLVSLDL